MFNYYPLIKEKSKIDIIPVELVNVKSFLIKEEEGETFSEDNLMRSVINWSKAVQIATGKKLSLGLKIAGRDKKSHQIIFNTNGLMNKFAGLKTAKDIEAFSSKFGLLGVKSPDSEQIDSPYSSVRSTIKPSFIFNDYGSSVFEPIEMWFWHIKEIQKILRLYHAVTKKSSDELIYEIVEIKMHKGMFGSVAEDSEITERYFVHWTNEESITMLPKAFEEKKIIEIARYALAMILESRLSDSISLATGDFISNPTTNEFRITEERYTKYLLAAIYYDLWQTINNAENVYLCENKNCRLPFVKSGRKKYCNEACKQEAYRIRIEEKEGME